MQQNTSDTPTGNQRLAYLERRLLESFDQLWDDFVDSSDSLYDVDGTRWTQVGGNSSRDAISGAAFADQGQLAEIREQCRKLAVNNEFAINGHENPVRKPTSVYPSRRVWAVGRRSRNCRYTRAIRRKRGV